MQYHYSLSNNLYITQKNYIKIDIRKGLDIFLARSLWVNLSFEERKKHMFNQQLNR